MCQNILTVAFRPSFPLPFSSSLFLLPQLWPFSGSRVRRSPLLSSSARIIPPAPSSDLNGRTKGDPRQNFKCPIPSSGGREGCPVLKSGSQVGWVRGRHRRPCKFRMFSKATQSSDALTFSCLPTDSPVGWDRSETVGRPAFVLKHAPRSARPPRPSVRPSVRPSRSARIEAKEEAEEQKVPSVRPRQSFAA